MRLKEFSNENATKIKETATAGATASGNIATVINPTAAHNKKSGRRKKNKPEDNALDSSDNLFGGSSDSSLIKRPY